MEKIDLKVSIDILRKRMDDGAKNLKSLERALDLARKTTHDKTVIAEISAALEKETYILEQLKYGIDALNELRVERIVGEKRC